MLRGIVNGYERLIVKVHLRKDGVVDVRFKLCRYDHRDRDLFFLYCVEVRAIYMTPDTTCQVITISEPLGWNM